MMWHGYIVVDKPDGATDQAWNAALPAIYTLLDGTPNHDDPSLRLHTAANGTKRIVEANFPLDKLHGDSLRTAAGLTPKLMAFEPGASRTNSLQRTHDYQKSNWGWSLMTRIFYPEDYGAVGDGAQENAANDTAAIQAAIDAAGAAGGGTVALTGTYAITNGGDTGIGTYQNIRYGLKVSYSNVQIVGPGTIKMNVLPTVTALLHRWITVLFTRTGPLAQNPGDGGDWIENVGISGVRFDNSAVTHADRQVLTMGLASSVNFGHARSFWCLDNTVVGGFGEGSLHCILGSREGRYVGNKIIGTPGNGMWLDGLRGSVIAHNIVVGEYWDYTERVAGAGIVTAANGDNDTNATHNVIHGNTLINCRTAALSLVGEYQIVSNNICWFNVGGNTGINIAYNDNSRGEWPSTGTVIRDNTLYHVNNIGIGKGIVIQGKIASAFDGTPIVQNDIVVTGNRVGGGWQAASVALGPHVTNSRVVNNFLSDDVTEDETCSGNTITPNY